MIENAMCLSMMHSKMYQKMLISALRAIIAAVAHGQTATAEANGIIWKQKSSFEEDLFFCLELCKF